MSCRNREKQPHIAFAEALADQTLSAYSRGEQGEMLLVLFSKYLKAKEVQEIPPLYTKLRHPDLRSCVQAKGMFQPVWGNIMGSPFIQSGECTFLYDDEEDYIADLTYMHSVTTNPSTNPMTNPINVRRCQK